MANPEHLQILQQGVEAWNQWRREKEGKDITADLGKSILDISLMDVTGNTVEVLITGGAFLVREALAKVDLRKAMLTKANFVEPNLSEADLRRANLAGADFSKTTLMKANLTQANLTRGEFAGPDLPNFFGASFEPERIFKTRFIRKATLTGANLTGANLTSADLSDADLTQATLTGADLCRANLTGANLAGANLAEAHLYETVFINTNLTATQGLETCVHRGPSALDHRTLAQSGLLPLAFLRGCGLPDALIRDYQDLSRCSI
jgi:uncharacterized protein YjbI with pentapeptide repeats